MNPVTNLSHDSFSPLQVAGTIRQASVTQMEASPNVVSQIIKSGTPKPHATISNNVVAAVDSYTPPPGRNMAHYVSLDVDKAGNDSTTVVDALQRYLNVRPRREPLADPKDVASNDSYPTLMMDEDTAWQDSPPFKFSINGVPQRQNQSVFYTQGGAVRARITGVGVTTITTPATEGEPSMMVGPLATKGMYYPPAAAAQLAMQRLTDMFEAEGIPPIPVGPELGVSISETLTNVADTLSSLRGATPGNFGQNSFNGFAKLAGIGAVYGSSPMLFLTAAADRLA